MPPLIQFENVHKNFGPKHVLRGVDFSIEAGEVIAIVGLSGAGKSVTLKHMIGLLGPTKGNVYVGGESISFATGKSLQKLRERFGYLFQSAALLQWLSVGENVALPLREHTKMKDDEIRAEVDEVLAKVELMEAVDRLPANISGGMKKRAGLARAIIRKPDIVLYDEPTSGLDPVTSRTIDNLIVELQKDLGITSIVVTHDMISALKIATRIIMLHLGELIEIAAPREFLQSENEVVRSFLDSQYIDREFLDRNTL